MAPAMLQETPQVRWPSCAQDSGVSLAHTNPYDYMLRVFYSYAGNMFVQMCTPAFFIICYVSMFIDAYIYPKIHKVSHRIHRLKVLTIRKKKKKKPDSILSLNTFHKIYSFFTPLSHILWFWCHISHLHVYPLTGYCNYDLFYNFWVLIFIVAYLSDWSTTFTIYLPILVEFFIYYKFLLLVVAFSFLLREEPLIFLVGSV